MKCEIKIQNYFSLNISAQQSSKMNICKQESGSDTSEQMRCGYREIQYKQKKIICSYRYIVERISTTDQKILSSHDIEEKSSAQQIAKTQKKRWQSKKKEQKQILLQDPTALNLYNEYRKYCSNNIMKNIKDGYIKFIISSNDTEKLEKMTDNNMSYDQIKRKVVLLKKVGSENKAIKIICKHQYLSIMFKYFLERIEEEWLIYSRIKQKEQCINLSKFLIKLIGLKEYIDIIEDYKK